MIRNNVHKPCLSEQPTEGNDYPLAKHQYSSMSAAL